MPNPGEYNFRVVQGDALPMVLRLKQDNGDLINLTGYEAEIILSWPAGSATLSSEQQQVILGGEDGTVFCIVPDEYTIQFPQELATTFQVRLKQPSAGYVTVLHGRIRALYSPLGHDPYIISIENLMAAAGEN